MIVKEFVKTRKDGTNLYRTYSDQGFMLRQIETNVLYEEPIDIEDTFYTYEETNILIKNNNKNNLLTLAPDEISPEEFMILIEEVL